MKQKDAVYGAIVSVMGSIEGNVSETITPEQRKQVNMILFEGFRASEIALDREFTDAELKQYCSGLTSNWLRKDTRLNGGSKYIAKNPGSRAGSSDAQLKAIRALKSTLTPDHADYEEVCQAEATRIAEITAAKVTKVVDFSALPAGLAEKFSK
jgi:hypothetical protein